MTTALTEADLRRMVRTVLRLAKAQGWPMRESDSGGVLVDDDPEDWEWIAWHLPPDGLRDLLRWLRVREEQGC